ncbi:MAG TPA: extracellular solute-binding protein [Ktedonobacteraceae bacterium]|jgi:multiple sugar transport system substrate-binding protein
MSYLASMRWMSRHSRRLSILSLMLILLVPMAACGGAPATSNGPVTLTFWSWVPNIQNEINLFEKSHPNIHIKLVNAGQGTPEYTKLRTALKANSGAPDVVQIEFQYLPTFELTGKLVDLSQYGANNIKNDFVPWTWSQVSQGSKVYGIPQDSGPMGLLYRQDIFDKYHLPVPQTWDQYAQEAVQLHKDNPQIYMTDFPAGDSGWLTGLDWQAGAHPFTVNGTNVSVNIDDAASLKVANYWGNLINEKVVQTTTDFTNDWYTGLSKGTYASWVTAAWGPVFLSGVAAQSAGKWRAVPLPQWTAGAHASSNWGGSSDAVTTQSAHPKEAAEFAMWLNDNKSSAMMFAQKQFLFPTLQSVLNDPGFNAPVAFYGGQKVNQVFMDASNNVDTNFQWSPFQDYVFTQINDQFGTAMSGKVSYSQAIHNVQNNVVSYAKAQGFTGS